VTERHPPAIRGYRSLAPLRVVAGIVLSIGFAALALRGVSVSAVAKGFGQVDARWEAVGVVLLVVGVWMRAERWRCLFPPGGRPSSRAVFWCLNLGNLFNNILPARAGEAVRILALRRETGVPAVQAAVTVVLERGFDLCALALLFLVTLPWLPSDGFTRALTWVSIVILVGSALATALASSTRARQAAINTGARLPLLRRWIADGHLERVAEGATVLRRARVAREVTAWSVASCLVITGSYWAVFEGAGVHPAVRAAIVAMVATNLGQVVPSAAASIGVFEAAGRLSITLFGIGAARALSATITLHVITVVPVVILGAVAVGRASRAPTVPARATPDH
jgi:glycosyltransferase 2 family protein